jgi:hypothetical protein
MVRVWEPQVRFAPTSFAHSFAIPIRIVLARVLMGRRAASPVHTPSIP